MPSGVFKPYAGVSTAILIFTKTNAGGTDKVWFYDMKADGYSLDDKRNPIAENDIADIIERFNNLDKEEERTRKEQEERKAKEEEDKRRKEERKRKQKEQRANIFGSLFDAAKEWISNATSEDENTKENNDQ